MNHDWCLEVWGDYGAFIRPELKVERLSYDVMTPSAARAIFEAILWKPAIRWHITKIEVLKPIQWISVRRNEVGKTISKPSKKAMKGDVVPSMGLFIEENRQQRAGLFLKDVRYRIHGYFDFIPINQRQSTKEKNTVWADEQEMAEANRIDETPAKYAAMFERRALKGQCFHRPYLGTREFACDFKLIRDPSESSYVPIQETRDLGIMLYDMDFGDGSEAPQAMFFRALMKDGVINTDQRQVEVLR
ncbi:MAG: type I-C CRISPR-associated protein Cas5 [Tissierellales bacterium]|nr:type I-C CRISPR-associated protein Cas5 [Tissierellales bacterium]